MGAGGAGPLTLSSENLAVWGVGCPISEHQAGQPTSHEMQEVQVMVPCESRLLQKLRKKNRENNVYF